MATTDTALLANTLSVPDTSATLIIDETMLAGDLVGFEPEDSPGDKGTLRMLSSPLDLADFLVLPVEILRVSGAGGIYLLLLESSGETFTQRDAVSLGQKIRLLRLESQDNLITATTVDARLGKFPNTEPTTGGVLRFRIEDGELRSVAEKAPE